MTCCAGPITGEAARLRAADLGAWIKPAGEGLSRIDFIVPAISGPDDMPRIEGALSRLPGVVSARVNLTAKRAGIVWRNDACHAADLLTAFGAEGFEVQPFDAEAAGTAQDEIDSRALLRALAVAGFAMANVMLLSVSVWSGAAEATRDMFHWISAMIALPAVAYAGQPFFKSAIKGLQEGRFSMDVPISLAVTLAALMSLFETVNHGESAYFDASVSLLFFLLTGRYLDQMMRARARSAVTQLMTLAATGATVISEDGARRYIAVPQIRPGMRLAVAPGERIPADGVVEVGQSDIDSALLTGESVPVAVAPGAQVHAGTMNLTGALTVKVTAAGEDTFLAEVIRLMASAEQGKSRYMRLADRLARIYSPAVHVLAAATLTGWLIYTGGDWHRSLMVAIAVLIITCPCALGLAVPAVQVVASGRLFRAGVMIKDGAALEKLAAADMVIFDKTGTLTLGRPVLAGPHVVSARTMALAAGLAQASRHPLAAALITGAAARGIAPAEIATVREVPGAGLEAEIDGEIARLGSRRWCGLMDSDGESDGLPETVFRLGRGEPVIFTFHDELRPGAADTIAQLKAAGLEIEILSGDRPAAVTKVAEAVGIPHWRAGLSPQDKLSHVAALTRAGRRPVMAGDGLNDAPALAAGFTSIAPASASDVGRTAADIVFMGDALTPMVEAVMVARRSQALARQNFALAILYNVLAVPVAMAGLASPFIAAIAMSTSSVIVIANALRLGLGGQRVLSGAAGSVAARPDGLREAA